MIQRNGRLARMIMTWMWLNSAYKLLSTLPILFSSIITIQN